MKKLKNIDAVIRILKKEIKQWKTPAVGIVAEESQDPFKILISCILSLRTKDEVTDIASHRLFEKASTPYEMLKLNAEAIQKLIYPVGFYKTKSRRILEISRVLIDRFKAEVPNQIKDLLSLKGVGRKTANLVITLGFGKDGICVDTHVHRISNRLGWIQTKNAAQTEFALMGILPRRYWKTYNDLLVTFGQNLCRPISPYCSRCPIELYCEKIGVTIHR